MSQPDNEEEDLIVDLLVDDPPNVANKSAGKSAKSSWVWDYFTPTKKLPECKLCNEGVNYGSSKSTSKLTNHLLFRHRSTYDEYMAKSAVTKRNLSGTLDNFVVYGGNFMKEYIRWVVMTYQPVSTCDNAQFRRMCATLSPKSATLSSDTVMREMLQIKDQVAEAMKFFLVDQRFALTTDHWTSCANESYMASTLHYIDDNWTLRSMTLNCSPHTGEKTGVLTAKLLRQGW